MESITYRIGFMRRSMVPRDLEFTSLHILFIDFTVLTKWGSIFLKLSVYRISVFIHLQSKENHMVRPGLVCLISRSDFISYKTVKSDWFTFECSLSFLSMLLKSHATM